MDHTALSLIELGAVFFGLGALGRLAGKIGLSPSRSTCSAASASAPAG